MRPTEPSLDTPASPADRSRLLLAFPVEKRVLQIARLLLSGSRRFSALQRALFGLSGRGHPQATGRKSPARFGFTHRAGLNATGVGAVALVLVAVGLLALVTGTSQQGKALAPSKAEQANAAVSVGPGPLATVLRARPYQLQLRLTPNRAAVPGTISVQLLKAGRPVNGARVRLTLSMLDMDMGHPTGMLPQTAPGRYAHAWPALGMSGRWRLRFDIALPGATPSSVSVIDRMGAWRHALPASPSAESGTL